MVAVSVLGLLARREQRTSLASTSQGERRLGFGKGRKWEGAVLFWASSNNFINRCEECPLLEDEDDISDEEMELMVR